MKDRAICLPTGETVEDAFQRTMDRRTKIEATGVEVEELWGHELDTMLRTDTEMANFFKECKLVEPMNPRDGLQGKFLYSILFSFFLMFDYFQVDGPTLLCSTRSVKGRKGCSMWIFGKCHMYLDFASCSHPRGRSSA